MLEPMRVVVTDRIVEYVLTHSSPLDELQRNLITQTRERFSDRAGMQVAPEQGAFLALLAKLTGARQVVEVGTFTGYSALCLARAIPADGHLLCCDISEEWTALAQDAWKRAGVSDRVELRLAPAIETLGSLPREEYLDLSFVDADKSGYWSYFEELVPRTKPGGLLIFDNVLFAGKVLDLRAEGYPAALREFNRRLADDDRVDVVMLPLADGLTLARKR